jgi:uncharacterized RDD family membrane protein YckC
MVNDSVWDELEVKVSAAPVRRQTAELPVSPRPVVKVEESLPLFAAEESIPEHISVPPASPRPPAERTVSRPRPAEPAMAKPKTSVIAPRQTSPTLVGFQSKNPAVPDWRLQLQNTIRQRVTTPSEVTPPQRTEARRPFATNGSAAVKSEPIVESEVAPHQNPRVANALRRIEESRRAFLPSENEPKQRPAAPSAAPASKNRPFNVISNASPRSEASGSAMVSAQPKPILVPTIKIEKKKYDTNKLPPISFDDVPPSKTEAPAREDEGPVAKRVIAQEAEEFEVSPQTRLSAPAEVEESDDLAPLSMRFNAALFDVIIGGFLGLALLSPFMIAGGDWVSVPGILAIVGGVFLVLFLYLTVSIGIYGQTFGMRLFSLELIDADENEYPTLHQAAVHSAVFILSLAGVGIGFLPMFFNEERRAAHDLVSGTVLVKEY